MILLELLYKLVFAISRWWRRLRTLNHRFSFRIISVGNLTVGGTGKSVFVDFLATLLGRSKCIVVLRGYKRKRHFAQKTVFVSDGSAILCDVATAGDEAFMHAQKGLAVVVDANRARACMAVEQRFAQSIRYALLDDSYQNYAVQKDLEILLLDARAPFDNGHCLPFGRLREKDYTRADVVIFTHADLVSTESRLTLKNMVVGHPAFLGAHVYDGLWQGGVKKTETSMLQNKRFLLSAGVGSISGVRATASQGGLNIAFERNFENHHAHNYDDIKKLMNVVEQNTLDGVVVTAKDWVKIEPLIVSEHRKMFFVMRVRFEFLSDQEYADFSAIVHRAL